jgi:hypothetical protein
MAAVPSFADTQLEAICKILADTEKGLTGSQIGELLQRRGIADLQPAATKWRRLFAALHARQQQDRCGNNVAVVIQVAMDPLPAVVTTLKAASGDKKAQVQFISQAARFGTEIAGGELIRGGALADEAVEITEGAEYTRGPFGINVPRGTTGAESAVSARRLAQQLTRQEASSAFTPGGALHPEVLARSRPIIPGSQIQNPAVIRELTADGSRIADWAKFSTETLQSPSGPFQVHFYRNVRTGAVNYTIDYKAVFNQGVQP